MKSLVFFIPLLLLISCRSIEPETPVSTVQEIPMPRQPLSQIVIPIELRLQPYFEMADKSVPMNFAGGEHPCEGVSYDYYFERNPLKLNGQDGSVSIDISGKYWLKMSYCPDCNDVFTEKPVCSTPRVPFSCGIGEPMRRMSIQYNTVISMRENYQLASETKLTQLKALDPCQVTVFKYDATDQLLKEVRGSLNDLGKEIDKQIGSIHFRKEAASSWKMLEAPILVPGYGFLHVQPKRIGLVAPVIDQNKVKTALVIHAYPKFTTRDTVFGSKPSDLPSLDILSHVPSNQLAASIDLNLQYDSISSLAQRYLGGTQLELEGRTIILDSISLLGASNKQVLFKIRFSGDKRGVLYLRGTPHFNKETQQLHFPDLDFDLETKNLLLKSAKWLFSEKITQKLKEATQQDLEIHLNEVRSILNQSLSFQYEAFKVNGLISKLEVEELFPAKQELFIRIRINGSLQVTN
jgi:hypothetical protein